MHQEMSQNAFQERPSTWPNKGSILFEVQCTALLSLDSGDALK
jgi:hypothetical protein